VVNNGDDDDAFYLISRRNYPTTPVQIVQNTLIFPLQYSFLPPKTSTINMANGMMPANDPRVPAKQLQRCIDCTDVIDIYVGPEKECFRLYRPLIVSSSDYFKKALKHDFRECETHRFDLTEDDADSFAIYAHWLIWKKLAVKLGKSSKNDRTEYQQLAYAYVLGDKLQDTQFRNDIINAFVAKRENEKLLPGSTTIDYIYTNTLESSKLRKFLVDVWFRFGSNNIEIKSLSHEFLTDLVCRQYIKRSQKALQANIEAAEYYVADEKDDHEMTEPSEDEEQSDSEESSS
jgi:hypothetical protein